MTDEFDGVLDVLNSAPTEQCIVREIFLDDLGIDAGVLGEAANRSVSVAYDFTPVPEKNMVLRDKVYVFSAKETA